MATLLEKAKASRRKTTGKKSPHDPAELLDLAVAYFNGEISLSQASAAMTTGNGKNVVYPITRSLRDAIAEGKVTKIIR